jgi:hypothetical protein
MELNSLDNNKIINNKEGNILYKNMVCIHDDNKQRTSKKYNANNGAKLKKILICSRTAVNFFKN